MHTYINIRIDDTFKQRKDESFGTKGCDVTTLANYD